jgi:excisionase family DNA binding protein
MSVEEAGEVLGLGRSAAYAAARRGEIPTRRFGRRVVVPCSALIAMLECRPSAFGMSTEVRE